ncbi:MAG: hypothetical protein L3J81_01810 [Thermoplasmata archaeon]|nr:hypothetical protein [Thermoplasmata archaeon]
MIQALLFAAGVANLGATPVYWYVGTRLYDRPVPARAKLPSIQFSLFWWGLGATGVVTGVGSIVASAGAMYFALGLTLYLLTVLGDVVILWGLVGYLLYLYTGRYHLLELSAGYAAFYVIALYWVIASGPIGVSFASGSLLVQYGHMLGGVVFALVIIGLIFPEVIATILYLSLFFRTPDPTIRYRIGMVGGSVVLFFLAAIFLPTGDLAALAKAVLDAGAAVLALFAYFPPTSLQRRLGVAPVAHEESGTPEGTLTPP